MGTAVGGRFISPADVWRQPRDVRQSHSRSSVGVLSRHRHAGAVHAIVLKGHWHYLEHDWIASEGGYVFEPPGEVHTLVVPDDVEEMITFFVVQGALVYVDPVGVATGYEDVFTKLDIARSHYASIGLGEEAATSLVR